LIPAISLGLGRYLPILQMFQRLLPSLDLSLERRYQQDEDIHSLPWRTLLFPYGFLLCFLLRLVKRPRALPRYLRILAQI
jgi:hypothetical protein